MTERIAEMKIRGRSDEPWVFRLVVTVLSDGKADYRLALRDLETDDGTVFDETFAVEASPGDSTQLAATWPVDPNARPQSLTAEAEVQSADSIRTVRRRLSFVRARARADGAVAGVRTGGRVRNRVSEKSLPPIFLRESEEKGVKLNTLHE